MHSAKALGQEGDGEQFERVGSGVQGGVGGTDASKPVSAGPPWL